MNLGIQHITLVRKELRTNGDRVWVHVPMWLKDDYPIVRRILANEVGREILNQCDADMIEESYRLQESLFKTNSLGLSQAIVPIVLQGEKIGFLLMKGFVLDSQSVADVVLTERFKVLMLDAKDAPLAVKEWRALPHFSTDKRLIVVQMLELIANEVAQFLNESLSAKEREDSIHKQTFSQIVTAHPPLKNLLKRFPQMAQANTPILITGEPGTGRELVAGMLHEMSLRKNAVFKSLHCSAVAEKGSLIAEAVEELFGE
jgi:transcriptional regulator with GAF, ATPase, and Fis domain